MVKFLSTRTGVFKRQAGTAELEFPLFDRWQQTALRSPGYGCRVSWTSIKPMMAVNCVK
jgi:hypothetical protein